MKLMLELGGIESCNDGPDFDDVAFLGCDFNNTARKFRGDFNLIGFDSAIGSRYPNR